MKITKLDSFDAIIHFKPFYTLHAQYTEYFEENANINDIICIFMTYVNFSILITFQNMQMSNLCTLNCTVSGSGLKSTGSESDLQKRPESGSNQIKSQSSYYFYEYMK